MKDHVGVAFDSSAGFRIWTDSEPLQAEAAGSDTVWRCRLAISVDSRYLANPAGKWEVRQGSMKQSGLYCGPRPSDAADLPKRAACIKCLVRWKRDDARQADGCGRDRVKEARCGTALAR